MRGYEYEFILRHVDLYAKKFQFPIFDEHPKWIYNQPTNGCIYFLKNKHLREFGFPRRPDVKKVFKWKKMNFTTNLPKNAPLTTYLVATGKDDLQCFRMHAVVMATDYSREHTVKDV